MTFQPITSGNRKGSLPRTKAVCDCCGRDEVIPCPQGAQGQAVKKVQKMGWSVIKSKLRCPACEAKRKAKTMIQMESPGPARQPTRAERREIMDLLKDVPG